ncbi:MAG: polyprenyl synthetase family protein [Chloroflexi bacterium]|nr:polyprenyl synthetase family protein [Chloroflexota bacterium]
MGLPQAPEPGPAIVDQWQTFEAAMLERRSLVYDYLDNWPGTPDFKPADIHDGLFSYIRQRGKALRPILLLLSCGAVGGDETQALPAAAAVEIFHTWTLVHDDIIDRDDMRRGSPTVHAHYAADVARNYGLGPSASSHYGMAVAILTGDLQQSWAYSLLGDLQARGVDARLVLELTRRMSAYLTPQLLEGEMLDVQYSLIPPEFLTEDAVLYMLGKKTASLLEYAAWSGVEIGLGGKPDAMNYAAKLARFAYLCGIAFQLRDDLLGLTADQALLGKPVGSDIREGKRTLVVYKALALASDAEKQHLLSTLGNRQADSNALTETLSILHSSGAYAAVEELATSYIRQSFDQLQELPETPYRALLAAWSRFLLERRH